MNILDFLALITIIVGFIVGLGAVTVIDILGFLGRTSSYWTEATTRTHKVTKPLIWVGIMLLISGGLLFFRNSQLDLFILYLVIDIVILISNGLFLTLSVSPYLIDREKDGKSAEILSDIWQNRIIVSFLISFIGWWSALFVFIYYLVFVRYF